MDYSHTQRGPLVWVVAVFFAFIVALPVALDDGGTEAALIMTAVMLPILGLVYAFSRLTVTVDDTEAKVAFGLGWPRRAFRLDDLAAIRQVRNRWWYGLGVRVAPNGAWIFSVWGLDAVELETKAGKKFRIGTDDSDALAAALAVRTSLRLT